ncbi:MAG: hypothetical protein V7638_3847 [Acidobacteriota bacterium]|jgi:hypothetical protein
MDQTNKSNADRIVDMLQGCELDGPEGLRIIEIVRTRIRHAPLPLKFGKSMRIVTAPGVQHGKSTQVFDDKGNEISHLVKHIVIDIGVGKVNTAWLEVVATCDVSALPEAIAVLRKCPDCLQQNPITDVTAFGDKSKRLISFTTEPEEPATEELK